MIGSSDYFLPKPLRMACWVVAGLIFYALFTRTLLADVAIVGQEKISFSSAWIALGNAVWQNPKSIAVIEEHPDFDEALRASPIPAAIGILPLVILALGRKRPLVGFLLLLSILPASLMVLMIATDIGYENSFHFYRPDAWFVADGRLEDFLGFTLPVIGYLFLFCGVVVYLLRWLVLRRRAIRSGPPHDQPL
jgi:hypothetical protein